MRNTISSHCDRFIESSTRKLVAVRDKTIGPPARSPLLPYTSRSSRQGVDRRAVPLPLVNHAPALRRSTLNHHPNPVTGLPPPRPPPLGIEAMVVTHRHRFLDEPHHAGGFNRVIQVYHSTFEWVALRQSKPIPKDYSSDISNIDRSQALAQTMQLWSTFDHPNILQLIDTCVYEGLTYSMSKWAANGTVKDYLVNHPNASRRRVLFETASGILYLHANDILHGDIKPTNLLVTADGHVLLCDFDLARPMTDTTHPGVKGAGSCRYQAPELWKTLRKSAKTDVYAFGMTVCEVLSGKIPFDKYILTGQVVVAVNEGKRPTPNPDHSPTNEPYGLLWEIARECWDKDPERRPSMQRNVDRLRLSA